MAYLHLTEAYATRAVAELGDERLTYTRVSLDPEGRQFICALSGEAADGEVIEFNRGEAYRLRLLSEARP